MCVTMTDYEYILKQVKLFHYKGWEAGELRKCVDMLPNLSRQELVSLYRSRWTARDKAFREAVFNVRFEGQAGIREELSLKPNGMWNSISVAAFA